MYKAGGLLVLKISSNKSVAAGNNPRMNIRMVKTAGRTFQNVMSKKFLCDKSSVKLHPTSSERNNQILDVAVRNSSYYNEEVCSGGILLVRNANSRGYLSYDHETDIVYSCAQYTHFSPENQPFQKKNHESVINFNKNDDNSEQKSQQEWKIIMIDDKVFAKKFEDFYAGNCESPRTSAVGRTSIPKKRKSKAKKVEFAALRVEGRRMGLGGVICLYNHKILCFSFNFRI